MLEQHQTRGMDSAGEKPPDAEIDLDHANSQDTSLLFSLPAELRLRIYEYVLGSGIIHVTQRDCKPWENRSSFLTRDVEMQEDTDELEELTDSESTVSRSRISKSGPPVTLQFNIPLGFHGPLIVKLDQALIASGAAQQMTLGNASSNQRDISAAEQQVTTAKKVGFLSLPPELRNKVYRLIFVADTDLRWGSPTNFCRSGQFLSTCRTVYSEGCSILYGENTFHFERNRTTRGYFWEPVHKEIGYKDFHQFLKKIGPENLAHLRDIKLHLEDATLCSTQYLNSVEDRRYINDEYLIDCLRILRTARLRKLVVGFYGRRALQRSDIKFLSYLEQIRVDSFATSNKIHWAHINKVHADETSRVRLEGPRNADGNIPIFDLEFLNTDDFLTFSNSHAESLTTSGQLLSKEK